MLRYNVLKFIKNVNILENIISKNAVHTSNLRHSQDTLLKKNLDKTQPPKNENESSSSEQQFFVRLKTDPDTFGYSCEQEILTTKDDLREESHFTDQPLPFQKLSTKKYAEIIKLLIEKRKIKEAIDVLEVRMLKQDKVKPENYIYNLLIGACGRVGYTKKAFMLFNDMKKRGLKVHPGAYTALFNACANSPWPLTDGLSRAKHLRDIMIEKGYEPNNTNYNAMIKAFGRCGDQTTAFSLVDEMITKGIPVNNDTINFLFHTCITDKEAGFRHALLVWRKLIQKNIGPNIYTFNLLLRCVRDCNIGDVETTKNVIDAICSQKLKEAPNIKQLQQKNNKINAQDSNETQSKETDPSIPVVTVLNMKSINSNLTETVPILKSSDENVDSRPNLIAKVPSLGNIISLTEIKKPEHRLLLIGGYRGFLDVIKSHNCCPDVKTFTQLLDCIPSTLAAEKELLIAMKKEGVKPDIDFFNMLIKKRSMRFDYDNAKEVLRLIKKANYRPDLITYGVLALGCKSKQDCVDLLEEMKGASYTLNSEILGAMLSQACYHVNFEYVLHIMELCLTEHVQPNTKFLQTLELFKSKVKKEKDLTTSFIKGKKLFIARLKKWINDVKVDESEKQHPWQQFRETNENEQTFKPKDTARFKPKRMSLFKVKTSTKIRY